MLTIICVRTGTKYGVDYVERLYKGVSRHLSRPFRFVCLTDQPETVDGVELIQIGDFGLPGWWAKLLVFNTDIISFRRIYFDLDTVLTGDLSPLADLDCEFGICENFTRLSGNYEWPCKFGSCVMTIGKNFGEHIWKSFKPRAKAHMHRLDPWGDQRFIEEMQPNATLLQSVLPPGFFLGYRDLPKHNDVPPGCRIIVFAGTKKPHNTPYNWIKTLWAA